MKDWILELCPEIAEWQAELIVEHVDQIKATSNMTHNNIADLTLGEALDQSGLRDYDRPGDLAFMLAVRSFATLIVRAERENCARICEAYQDAVDRQKWPNGYDCAAAIREQSDPK